MKAIRRVKEKSKNKISQRKVSIKAKRIKTAQKPGVLEAKKEMFGSEELVIGKTKFSPQGEVQVREPLRWELPPDYGRDKIVLQVRDPWWLHAYWEIRYDTLEKLKGQFHNDFYKAKRILRVYDVSYVTFKGNNANRFFDIEVNESSNNWYIDTGGPGRSWCVDIGILLPGGKFITIARSNIVQTPLDGPSWITDEEWMIPDDMFARLYGMGFGLGRSSPVGRAWKERVKKVLYSGAFVSASSPVKRLPRERKFWLKVDCELIVYGATEPDAKVTVQGKHITLRPDGTFTLRYAFGDGKQVIPVKAESADKKEERTITPVVSRETKNSRLLKE